MRVSYFTIVESYELCCLACIQVRTAVRAPGIGGCPCPGLTGAFSFARGDELRPAGSSPTTVARPRGSWVLVSAIRAGPDSRLSRCERVHEQVSGELGTDFLSAVPKRRIALRGPSTAGIDCWPRARPPASGSSHVLRRGPYVRVGRVGKSAVKWNYRVGAWPLVVENLPRLIGDPEG